MTTPTPGAGSPGSGVAGGVLAAVGALALIATVLALVLAFGPAGRDDAGAGAERRRWNGGFTPAPPTVNTQGYAEPVQGRVTSRFGPRPNPFGEGVVPSGVSEEALTRHDGVDLGRAGAVLAHHGHPDPLGHPARGRVLRVDDRHELVVPQHVPGVVPAGGGRFGGVAAPPQVGPHVVADLQARLPVDLLPRQAAVAHEAGPAVVVGLDDPQPVPVPQVPRAVAGDPQGRLLGRLGGRVVGHHGRVTEQRGHGHDVGLRHLAEAQAGGGGGEHGASVAPAPQATRVRRPSAYAISGR